MDNKKPGNKPLVVYVKRVIEAAPFLQREYVTDHCVKSIISYVVMDNDAQHSDNPPAVMAFLSTSGTPVSVRFLTVLHW